MSEGGKERGRVREEGSLPDHAGGTVVCVCVFASEEITLLMTHAHNLALATIRKINGTRRVLRSGGTRVGG